MKWDDRQGGNVDVSENKAVRNILKELDSGINDKVNLLKMLAIRCDEADGKFNRLRDCMYGGETDKADRILSDLQACNGTTQADAQNETADGPDLIAMIGQLSQLLQSDRGNRARSRGRSNDRELDGGKSRERSASPLKSSLRQSRAAENGTNERIEALKR